LNEYKDEIHFSFITILPNLHDEGSAFNTSAKTSRDYESSNGTNDVSSRQLTQELQDLDILPYSHLMTMRPFYEAMQS